MPVYNLDKLNLAVSKHSTFGVSISLASDNKPMCQLKEQTQEFRSAQESKADTKASASKEIVMYAQGEGVNSLFVGVTSSEEHAKFLADHKFLEGKKGAVFQTYTIDSNKKLSVQNNADLQKEIQLLQQQVTQSQARMLFSGCILTSYGAADLSGASSLKNFGERFKTDNYLEKAPLIKNHLIESDQSSEVFLKL